MPNELPRDNHGHLESFAFPGGYDIAYLDGENSLLCARCARESDNDLDEIDKFKPVSFVIITEPQDDSCSQCSWDFTEENKPVAPQIKEVGKIDLRKSYIRVTHQGKVVIFRLENVQITYSYFVEDDSYFQPFDCYPEVLSIDMNAIFVKIGEHHREPADSLVNDCQIDIDQALFVQARKIICAIHNTNNALNLIN